jgi:HAD superfamily hydrolase (TIGR01509 family)
VNSGRIPKLVIFDCDGVLVDSESLANQVLVHALASHGLYLSSAEALDAFSGFTPKDTITLAENMLGSSLPDNFWDNVQNKTFAAFQRYLRPIEGAIDLVGALKKKGIKVCVASSGAHKKMDLTLRLTGLEDMIRPHVFSAEDVPDGKPAPDLFLFAAKQMGCEPSDCLVVEDSRPGIEAALAAGIKVVLFDPDGRHDIQIEDVVRVTTLNKILALIG